MSYNIYINIIFCELFLSIFICRTWQLNLVNFYCTRYLYLSLKVNLLKLLLYKFITYLNFYYFKQRIFKVIIEIGEISMNQCTYRIGCMSKDRLLPKNLEAMIKVIHDLSLSSHLVGNWIYSEDNPDIHIIDLDSGYTNILIPKKIKIVLSNNPELLKGYQYGLKRPIRYQELLNILQDIEKNEYFKKSHQERIINNENIVSKDHLETKILYKLVCYPNFKNIHAEQIVNVTRVCALLSIESKTAQEIKRFLNLSIDEIQKIIEIIKKEAYPNYETIHENIVSILPFSTEAISTVPQRIEQNSLFYFLIKFWKRLKGEL